MLDLQTQRAMLHLCPPPVRPNLSSTLVRRAAAASACAALACILSGCLGGQASRSYSISTRAEAARGKQQIVHYGCGKCHTIPGIPNAHGVFGPPLMKMGSRTMVAGNFPNTPTTLANWIHSPKSMKPKTAMPDLGLTDQQAQDAAAYLETLR